jgi:hypothetical protein
VTYRDSQCRRQVQRFASRRLGGPGCRGLWRHSVGGVSARTPSCLRAHPARARRMIGASAENGMRGFSLSSIVVGSIHEGSSVPSAAGRILPCGAPRHPASCRRASRPGWLSRSRPLMSGSCTSRTRHAGYVWFRMCEVEWRRIFLESGTQGFKKRVDPEERELKRVPRAPRPASGDPVARSSTSDAHRNHGE